MRSGTLATHQIVGMGGHSAFAARKCRRKRTHPAACAIGCGLGCRRLTGFMSTAIWNAGTAQSERQLQLCRRRIADHGQSRIWCSSGSACTSDQPGTILRCAHWAVPTNWHTARSAFTIGRFTTVEEVDYAPGCCSRKSASCANCRRCGNASGRHRSQHRAMGGTLIIQGTSHWLRPATKFSTITKTRAMSARSKGAMVGRHRHGRRAGLR